MQAGQAAEFKGVLVTEGRYFELLEYEDHWIQCPGM
jgi:hypothetical protein